MATDTAWPPRSPHQALLSSPSGRRKFQQYQSNNRNHDSPIRRSITTPNLRHMAASKPCSDEDGEQEDDEETLQLKLAAIEAKLKLKKLQQNKSRSKEVDDDHGTSSRPLSAIARHSTATSLGYKTNMREPDLGGQPGRNPVEIPLSPRKQQIPQQELRSPGRILLGIDKGVTGSNVSLRRARSIHTSPIKKRLNVPSADRSSSRVSVYGLARSAALNGNRDVEAVMSFSERMTEARDTERSMETRRNALNRTRGAGLKLDEAELESYKLAAEEADRHDPPRSPTKQRQGTTFNRDDIINAHRKVLKKSRTLPDLREASSRPHFANQKDNIGEELASSTTQVDSTLYEPFSHLNLSSRILPDSFLKRTLPTETFTNMRISDLLKEVSSSTAFELPESVIDYVVFGVVASKSTPMDQKPSRGAVNSKGTNDWEKKWEDGSQNQRKFMVLTLTDLKWTVDLYLFGTAVPRYHRLSPGTVVAIVNPNIMPPKRGKEDTSAFSLALHNSDDKVLEIGTCRDLGFCNAVKKDGKQCGQWVNSAKAEICEFHLNLQVAKSQSSRMGVNAGSNGFGTAPRSRHLTHVPGSRNREEGEGRELRGLLPCKEGPRYDKFTGSHFFIASSTGGNNRSAGTPIYRAGGSTAHMLDQNEDDPFIAEGLLSRDDKAGRMRKRLETQAKERTIADKLVAMGSGGAGGDYLRHRAERQDGKTSGETGSQRSAMVNRDAILSSGSTAYGNKKRTAESVRLSPVKKTRFVTERGIKVAGRESLGAKRHDNDDDELDIV